MCLIVLHLSVADAAVVAMLADDRGFWLLQLELSRHAVEEESLAPLNHTGHLKHRHMHDFNCSGGICCTFIKRNTTQSP